MLKTLFFFVLLIKTFSTVAQVREVAGLVTNAGHRASGVIIENTATRLRTTSDDKGQFVIKVKAGDTIIAVKDDTVKGVSLITDQQSLIIKLNENTLFLKEVVITGKAVTPEAVYEASKKDYRQIYFLGDNTGIFLTGSLVNIDKLNNALGRKGHRARHLQYTLTKDYRNSVVDKRFNHLAASVTEFKKVDLENFIQKYRPSYDTITKLTDYDIIQYIKQKLTEDKLNINPRDELLPPSSG